MATMIKKLDEMYARLHVIAMEAIKKQGAAGVAAVEKQHAKAMKAMAAQHRARIEEASAYLDQKGLDVPTLTEAFLGLARKRECDPSEAKVRADVEELIAEFFERNPLPEPEVVDISAAVAAEMEAVQPCGWLVPPKFTKEELATIAEFHRGFAAELKRLAEAPRVLMDGKSIKRLRVLLHRCHENVARRERARELREELRALELRSSTIVEHASLEQVERMVREDRALRVQQCANLAEKASAHAKKTGCPAVAPGVDETTPSAQIVERWHALDAIERELGERAELVGQIRKLRTLANEHCAKLGQSESALPDLTSFSLEGLEAERARLDTVERGLAKRVAAREAENRPKRNGERPAKRATAQSPIA